VSGGIHSRRERGGFRGARRSAPLLDMEWRRDCFRISTDPAELDLEALHACLSRSYWAAGIPREIVERSVRHSLCFGVYDEREEPRRQVAFARVVTDRATFAYLGDVFVVEDYRGRGLSKWLMECIRGHPELQGLRRWSLATRDAHGLYGRFDFTPLADPGRWMEIYDAEVYARTPR
jgi:GNAT superfamily N-acetyltransferase